MAITWDFFNKRVQKGLPHGQFLSARSTVIGAGPPNILALGSQTALENISASGNELVFLMGVVQSLQLSQAQDIHRLHEVGSNRHYFITGHNRPNIQLTKVLYHGPNILRSLYAYYKSSNGAVDPILSRYKGTVQGVNVHAISQSPGFENLFINLTSDLFSQPVGLLFLMRDQNELTYGMFYAENCYVAQHGIGYDANGVVIGEQVSVEAERIVPLSSSAVELVKLVDEAAVAAGSEGDLYTITGTTAQG